MAVWDTEDMKNNRRQRTVVTVAKNQLIVFTYVIIAFPDFRVPYCFFSTGRFGVSLYLWFFFGVRIQLITIPRPLERMDLRTKANNVDYLKALIFTKEQGILKLIDLVPNIQMQSSTGREIKIVYLKIFPVFFSHVELNKKLIEQSLFLIAEIKRHPLFMQEKSMFDPWQIRLKSLLPGYEASNKNIKLAENKFFNIPGTRIYDMVGYTELDLFFRYHKWLKHHKLHKYLYFFANLSYTEIQRINADTIQYFEEKIDLHTMTTGARNAIVKKLAELNQRSARLEVFCQINYYTSSSKVEKSINEIKTILKTPIKKNRLLCQSELPESVKKAIETVIFMVLRLPREDMITMYEPALSLLKMAWGCTFFEPETKDELNILQSNLNSKWKSCFKKSRFIISKNIKNNNFYSFAFEPKEICAVHFDIENGIKEITRYLENVILVEKF